MRLLLITDTWEPDVNGVVTTLRYLTRGLTQDGHLVKLAHPGQYPTVRLFCHNDLRMVTRPWRVTGVIDHYKADAVHIFTEGPLGICARIYCARYGIPFTTSYHTRFPEFGEIYLGIPTSWFYPAVQWFHAQATRTLVPTVTMREILSDKMPLCKNHLVIWNRATDHRLFNPRARDRATSEIVSVFASLKPPILLCVSRLDKEKGIEAFCRLPATYSKILVGDGQEREYLQKKYDEVIFMGLRTGTELAAIYALAHVFVFPSVVDTFGNVMLESMACGTPIVAYKVPGPLDVIVEGQSGYLVDVRDELGLAGKIDACAKLDRRSVYRCSFKWNLAASRKDFVDNLDFSSAAKSGNTNAPILNQLRFWALSLVLLFCSVWWPTLISELG